MHPHMGHASRLAGISFHSSRNALNRVKRDSTQGLAGLPRTLGLLSLLIFICPANSAILMPCTASSVSQLVR